MRSTCLQCEQEGVVTPLVQTGRGGVCPTHGAEFLTAIQQQALAAVHDLRRPELLGKGVPRPR